MNLASSNDDLQEFFTKWNIKQGDWVAKWSCNNILDFHARRPITCTKIIDCRTIAQRCSTVNRRSWAVTTPERIAVGGGTRPVRSAGKIFVVLLYFLKCPLKWSGSPHALFERARLRRFMLKTSYFLHIETWLNLNSSWRKNVNTLCILTLMVAWGSISSWSVATKVGDYNKTWDVPPVQASNRHWTWCNRVNGCPQEIGEGKGQHTYVWAMDSCHWHV